MYDVITLETLETVDYEDIAKELKLQVDHVKSYFINYPLYKNFPIKDLTYDEINLVKAINKVKLMTDVQLKTIIIDNQIDISKIHDDQLLIEKHVANYHDEEKYKITRKYQHFVLEPAILHGNFDAPITKPLSMEDILIQMSNIAIGVSGKGEIIDAKTKISAMSKISDIYIAHKMLSQGKEPIDEDIYEDMSPSDITKLIDYMKKNNNEMPQDETIIKKPKSKAKSKVVKENQNIRLVLFT